VWRSCVRSCSLPFWRLLVSGASRPHARLQRAERKQGRRVSVAHASGLGEVCRTADRPRALLACRGDTVCRPFAGLVCLRLNSGLFVTELCGLS